MLLAKTSVARLAESVLSRLCKLSGGSAYTWYSPLGAWFEDVRALGYLRPPWALAYDQLYTMGWQENRLGGEGLEKPLTPLKPSPKGRENRHRLCCHIDTAAREMRSGSPSRRSHSAW